MSDHLVKVRDRDVLDIHQLAADFVNGVILVHHQCVRQCVQTRQGEDRIVVLHDDLQREEKPSDHEARQFNNDNDP